MMTFQVDASPPTAEALIPKGGSGCSLRGPDAAGYPAYRNFGMGAGGGRAALRPNNRMRKFPAIQPLSKSRDWKALVSGILAAGSPNLAKDDKPEADNNDAERGICGRHFLFNKTSSRLERTKTVIPPLPRDYHVQRPGNLHPFSLSKELSHSHSGRPITLGYPERYELNRSPAILFPSTLVLSGRNTFSVESCKLSRPKVNYPTSNLLPVKDNQKSQSYPDPMVGASRSFIHRISELSSLEGEAGNSEDTHQGSWPDPLTPPWTMASPLEFVCWFLVASTLGKNFLVSGGCAGKCCRGRDMGCTATDWRMDRVYGTCYCDEGCVRTKDCCFDYFTECPAQDCAVSDWSFWSGCARPCQPSVRVRVRHVERQPGNSGVPCPSLEQRSGCREYRDHQGVHCGLHAGPAFITSMEFGKGRPKHDSYGNPLEPGFCMEFKLESRTPHCTVENRPHTHWMRYITEGFKVCVACEPPAMRNNSGSCQGDGQESDKEAVLHWQAVGNHRCSGTWRKIQKTQRCSCPPQHSFVFI